MEDYQRERAGDIETGWNRAVLLTAELGRAKGIEIELADVVPHAMKHVPHAMKHTAITCTKHKGASPWEAAGYFSTSLRTIEDVYGHHSPEHQQSAAAALNRRA